MIVGCFTSEMVLLAPGTEFGCLSMVCEWLQVFSRSLACFCLLNCWDVESVQFSSLGSLTVAVVAYNRERNGATTFVQEVLQYFSPSVLR